MSHFDSLSLPPFSLVKNVESVYERVYKKERERMADSSCNVD